MNKTIRFLVWFFLTIILVSGFLITKKSFAADADYIVLSHQYNRVFADMLIKKINTVHKNYPVVLYLKDGKVITGIFKSYNKSDESIWIEERGWTIQMGYGVMELMDIKVLAHEPV